MTYDEMTRDISNETLQKIISLIRYHINNKLPFALARYGDGECDLIRHKKLTPPILHRFKKIFDYIPNEEYFLKFQKEFKEACSHIDVNVFQTCKRSGWYSEWFYNEMCNNNIIDKKSIKIPIGITNKLFDNGAGERRCLLQEIIKPGEEVVLITCRIESGNAIKKLTGANIRKIITIPSEGEFRIAFQDKDKTSQLPHRINEIIHTEIPKYIQPGTIVLLGTGPTKPMYCKAIKQYGGIALDLGSSLDAISGYLTRGSNKGTLVRNLGEEQKKNIIITNTEVITKSN